MKESNMQTMWGKYLKEYPPEKTEVYELKICKGTSIPFDRIPSHQIEALQSVSRWLYHKLTDAPIYYGMQTRFQKPKPFDCFCIVKSEGFLVVWFYKPRQPKRFIKIKIDDFLKMKEHSKRKSMTEAMALEIAYEVVKI